jgi:allantoate deiminase
VWCGSLEPSLLGLVDAEGVTMAAAVREAGGDPAAIGAAARRADDLLGYVEVHIEQGPQLDDAGLPVAVVSRIAGQTRGRITIEGEAGHAGTLPMTRRRDALAGAAELVLAVEQVGRSEPGLVATVGKLEVSPGATNVVPGRVVLSLDLRHPEDDVRRRAGDAIAARAAAIGATRELEVAWAVRRETPAVAMDPALTALLAQAAADRGADAPVLVSGAGHDAAMVAAVTASAMLFVRCAGGVSHHPAEAVTEEDVAVALDVLEHCVELVAAREAEQADGD